MTKIKHSIMTSIELDNGMRLNLNINQQGINVVYRNKRNKFILNIMDWIKVLNHIEEFERKEREKKE